MAPVSAIDMQIVAATGFGLLLICCLVLFYSMRDRRRLPPHNDALVYCPTHQRYAAVDFSERIASGTVDRQLEYCSLLAPGARCNQICLEDVRRMRSGGKATVVRTDFRLVGFAAWRHAVRREGTNEEG